MLRITQKGNISRYWKFFLKPDGNVENINNLILSHICILPTWSHRNCAIRFPSTWSLFAAHQHVSFIFAVSCASLFQLTREIHRSNSSLHALCIWPIFLCAGNEENNIPLYPVLYLSFTPPAPPPLSLSFSRFLSRVQLAFSRLSFVLSCSPFFEICANRPTQRLIREWVNWYRRW